MKRLTVILFLLYLLITTGCVRNSVENKLEGFWAVDINDSIIEKNKWHELLGNTFNLKSNFTCKVLPFNDPHNYAGILNTEGTWKLILDKDEYFIVFDVQDNPMSGKYKIEFYRDYSKKLLKMRLSNSTTEFTCAKFFQNFDRVTNW